jgi:hypothetical protein
MVGARTRENNVRKARKDAADIADPAWPRHGLAGVAALRQSYWMISCQQLVSTHTLSSVAIKLDTAQLSTYLMHVDCAPLFSSA